MLRKLSIVLACLVTVMPCFAQTRALTTDDYSRAEKFMGYNTNPLVLHAGVRPTWLPDERFWYRVATENGNEFVLIDPARGTRNPAFDHAKVAAALSAASGTAYTAYRLPFQQFDFASSGRTISFNIANRRWTCDLEVDKCTGAERKTGAPGTTSPDGKLTAFIRNYNLWVRDTASGKEKQLTKDGVKDFGYATDNAGWVKSDRPVLVWSPDSRKIATFQQDDRPVGEMYLVSAKVGHPELQQWKYPLPGDSSISMIHRVVINVDTPRVVRFQMPADAHRSTLCDHVICRGTEWADVEWYPDGSHVAFVSTSRDHKHEVFRVADAATGTVRDVFREDVATQYESGNGMVNWRVLPATNEVIWFSERDDWGQLYLYDLSTGQLKSKITSGDGNVAQLRRVDEKSRTIWFVGNAKE